MTLSDTAASDLRTALLAAVKALEAKQEPTVESEYGKTLEELKPYFRSTHAARIENGKPVMMVPKRGVWFLNMQLSPELADCDWEPGDFPEGWYRLILDPLPPKPVIPPAPEGFEWILDEKGERAKDYVNKGQWFLAGDGTPVLSDHDHRGCSNCPAYILRKKEPPEPKRIVFEFARRGKAIHGDWYCAFGKTTLSEWNCSPESNYTYDIYRLVEGA